MSVDFQDFNGLSSNRIIRKLLDEGYEDIGGGFDSAVLALPGDDRVVRVTNFADQAQAFAALCRKQEDNRYLPKVYDTHRIDGDPPVFLTIMERLQALDEIPEEERRIAGGFARALALLIDDHPSHAVVYGEMLKNKELSHAVMGLAGTLQTALEKDNGTFLYYDSGYSEDHSGPLEEWYPDNVLFRPQEAGGWDLVFSDPFREGFVKDENHREKLAQTLCALQTRLKNAVSADPVPATTSPLPPG